MGGDWPSLQDAAGKAIFGAYSATSWAQATTQRLPFQPTVTSGAPTGGRTFTEELALLAPKVGAREEEGGERGEARQGGRW